MAAIEVESVEDDSPAKNPEDSGHISWNNSQTRMLIAHFKDNPILWDKQLKDKANRQKTKKAMTTLLARFEKAQPPRNLAAIKLRWHSLRSSVLRYMKKQKESFQSKVAARAPLLMAAILFFPVHEHKEFWSLSLIGSTFDSVLVMKIVL